MVGGPGSDFISFGSNNAGAFTVFGDNAAVGTALTEDDTGLNAADGDDIITIGN